MKSQSKRRPGNVLGRVLAKFAGIKSYLGSVSAAIGAQSVPISHFYGAKRAQFAPKPFLVIHSAIQKNVSEITHKQSLQMTVFCGKLPSVFCVAQSVHSSWKPSHLGLLTQVPLVSHHPSGITLFLIASLPIRNVRNLNGLNKISISNRQKTGIFNPLLGPPQMAPRIGSGFASHLPLATAFLIATHKN
ncbi:MAG TPA: hypothetical protein VJN69_02030 [Candidatus Acidoferrales bacterium]|nr:hypothetical protein [Candidatus Acidoferrales bacterium]